MTGSTETFRRPNGKAYRPRKAELVAHAWEDTDYRHDESGVIVFGTLDPQRAEPFAAQMCNYWYGAPYAVDAKPGWYRLGFSHGERMWLVDEVRGRPGVQFTAAHEPAKAVAS